MENLKIERYGYFLIWGHGIQLVEDILNILRSHKNIEILRIQEHIPKNIANFVRTVYSYDYAPFHHLKSKTKYLLNTPNKVLLIFIKNKNAQERFFGENDFRHLECEYIKSIKEEIRNKYNPRKDGKRTENHVIHASDNESQVDFILKKIGIKEGIRLFAQNKEALVPMPYYLPPLKKFTIKEVNIENILCKILYGTKNKFHKRLLPVEETPHYRFLKGELAGYIEYLKTFLYGPLSCDYYPQRLSALCEDFKYLESPYETDYIITKKMGNNRYVILDGVHRASILKLKEVNHFPILIS